MRASQSKPQTLKPSDWLRHHVCIELKKQHKESKELSKLIHDMTTATLSLTKTHAGTGTELHQLLAEKKRCAISSRRTYFARTQRFII